MSPLRLCITSYRLYIAVKFNMQKLHLHEFHSTLGARFGAEHGTELVLNYGNPASEYQALRKTAALLDLSFRGRVCITGKDRARFLHGQVTNKIQGLQPGEGTYAALVNAKGRMESDLNIYVLSEELLLDFEPGLTATVSGRLEKYIVADDVQVIDVGALYGLLSVQGPQAAGALRNSGVFAELPEGKYRFKRLTEWKTGELYLMNNPRFGEVGFDLFVPMESMASIAERIFEALGILGGRWAGWDPQEAARIELGIPRFGIEMDGSNFPQESGIEASAVSYDKGCYIGQEVLNRIHTLGHVNRQLRGLVLAPGLKALPVRGDKLFREGKEAGCITSALASPGLKQNIALGLVRKEAGEIGTQLSMRTADGETAVRVVSLPFDGS
jgi:folate-binding protein YgfZ